ncbi:Bromodomain-containing protein [Tilletiaria anomala UBC 951]|uniref:Bromodomain-containing protein n=1 Tax=Tilletiaria anomala (strain ATCC 24038 / CBS 436.72 / UBC 951) TaxID=1037660 RepID=A0A066VNC5_TILAU|nr:Bromodomain-containing protein [Tilletiaria anomala UBC 951]KDN41778.1 Bromodomain-containing protein [Tilletiaria anomala UBC 951]
MAEPKSNLAQQSAQAASTSALAPVTATVSVSATPSASATSTPAAVHARTSATPATPVAVAIGVGSSETPRSDAEPPNKRQRTQSDFDPSIIIGGDAGEIKLTLGQIKYAQNCIKALKGRTEARAFLAPVDPVLLGIPHYRNIITNPMDLGTVDIKLALTAAAAKGGNKPTEKVKLAPKWGLDPAKDVYTQVEEFERDVRLTFQNCRTFNGPQHAISQSADLLDGVFDKQMKSFPPADAPPPPEFLVDEKPSAGIPGAAGAAASGSGTSGGLAGNEQDRRISLDGRPKREVHPPPPRDIQYDEPQALKNKKKKKSRASMTPAEAMHWDKVAKEELKFCSKLIDDLLKPTHQDVAWVFYELPDRSYDFAPAYYAMIKKPISLMLIQRKVKNGQYVDGEEFDADMQLLFRNCFTFNPPGSDVALMGERLKETYEKLFMKKPEPKPFVEEESDEDEEPDEATGKSCGKPTAKMLAVAKGTLSTLGALPEVAALTAPVKKEAPKRRKSVGAADAPKKAKKPKKEASAPESAVKKSKKPKKSSNGGGGRLGSDEEDVRVVTYEQKEELAAKITELPDDRLEGALKIIAEDKPHSANDDEEIELDIDDLSAKTLYKLYRYVVRPKNKKTTNSNPAKNASDGRKRGTGGLKRKNLDEGEESERIRRLQAQLQQFEGGADGGTSERLAHVLSNALNTDNKHFPSIQHQEHLKRMDMMTLSRPKVRAKRRTATILAATTKTLAFTHPHPRGAAKVKRICLFSSLRSVDCMG